MDHKVRVNGHVKQVKPYTPTIAIRHMCRDCYPGYKGHGVPDCGIKPAPDRYDYSETGVCEIMRWLIDGGSKMRAIHKHCLDCEGRWEDWVRDCLDPECPLYPYRLGTNPARKGLGPIKKGAKSRAESSSPQLELGFPSAAG
jgi:hypothetical protein